jgi:2-C-methyl-D-erythritol 2,4-cyclodiphosphate synthase
MRTRIGQGIDVHAFGPGDHLVLGGVRIPFERGIEAHSDGDVALHALCDALLGAAALGDLGVHFPPHDAKWRDADSRSLLSAVALMLAEHGWRVTNCDVTVVCERPKISPYSEEMRRAIARVLDLPTDAVSVKATTTDGLGFCGRSEGVLALAVAQIEAFA